jgi:chromatin remodeling complex protein RSC6
VRIIRIKTISPTIRNMSGKKSTTTAAKPAASTATPAAAPKAAAAAPKAAAAPVAAAPAVVAAPVAVAPAAAPKAAAKGAAKKAETVVAPVVVEAPVVAAATTEATTASTEATETVTNEARFAEFSKKIASLQDLVKTLSTSLVAVSKELSVLQKSTAKELKEASKGRGKRGGKKADGAPRGLSGLTKPTLLSEELCKFLGVPAATQLGRSEVAKLVHGYVVKNNLQKPTNKKVILPDANMKGLLKLQSTDELSYFNIMHYLKPHFIKSA